MFISSVDVDSTILFTILISFLVFLFIFSFGSFFLFFIGCDLVSSSSSRYSLSVFFYNLLCYLLVVFCVIFWQSSVLSSGSLLSSVLSSGSLLSSVLSSSGLLCYLLAVFCVIFIIIIIIVLVTLILSGGAVAMFHQV